MGDFGNSPLPGTDRNSPMAAAPTATHYVRLDVLLTMVPMSSSAIWRKVWDGSFVKPAELSSRVAAGNFEVVEVGLREREAK